INGLQKDVFMPDQITLGGDLQWNTQLTQAGNDFTFQGAENQNNVMIQPRLRIQSGSPADGKVLTSDPVGNATWESAPLKGVVAGHGLATEGAGTKTSPLMVKLIDANTDGQFLKWNNTTGQWELAPGYTGTAPITVSATNAISLNEQGVTRYYMADDAVNSAKIENGTVTVDDLAANSVNSSKIVDLSIVNGDIANTTITQAKLVGGAAGQVLTATGGATAPTWQALPANNDNEVGNEVLNATAGGGLVRAGAGTASDWYTLGIASQGVQTGMLADQAVTSAKIADGTILNGDISPNTIQASRLTGTGSTSGMVLTSSGPSSAPVWAAVKSGGVNGQTIEAGSSAIVYHAQTPGPAALLIVTGTGIFQQEYAQSTAFLYDAGFTADVSANPRPVQIVHAITTTTIADGWIVAPY
ncbi:hypothetical protein IR083_11075, partial [Dysgonomonas sp. GY75]|uniref:hypothetical protein n=1 Tax=Dysgonomonas sp. GY75 TaxID=2780419 RepID=UPI0018840DED